MPVASLCQQRKMGAGISVEITGHSTHKQGVIHSRCHSWKMSLISWGIQHGLLLWIYNPDSGRFEWLQKMWRRLPWSLKPDCMTGLSCDLGWRMWQAHSPELCQRCSRILAANFWKCSWMTSTSTVEVGESTFSIWIWFWANWGK